MLNVQFKLKIKHKPTEQVFLHTNASGKKFQMYTGLRCTPEQWDTKKQRFRKNFDCYQSANDLLESLSIQAVELERKIKAQGRNITVKDLDVLKAKQTPVSTENTLQEWSDRFVKFKTEEGLKPSSIRSHKATQNHLLEFATLYKLPTLETLTDEVFEKFFRFLRTKKNYHPNTFAGIAKNTRTFLNYAEDNGAKLSDKRPTVRKVYSAPKREFVTLEELNLFLNFSETQWEGFLQKYATDKKRFKYERLPTFETAVNICDAFCFACMTGLRISDLKRLNKSHIIDIEFGKALKFIPEKSTSFKAKMIKELVIALIPDALSILEKYKDFPDVLVPLPVEQHYNIYIKYIAEAVGLTQNIEIIEYTNGVPHSVQKPKYEIISSHIARHSFATLSRIFGLDLADLRDVMGHSDIRTTAIYDHLANEYKAKKQGDIWNSALKK